MIDKLGGRKFTGFIVIAFLLTILVLVGKVSGSDLVTFLTLNFGIYVGGNVGETAVAAK